MKATVETPVETAVEIESIIEQYDNEKKNLDS